MKKLIEDVRINGTGEDYLIQHSAGSGKSNSIAWLAYGLSNLHDKEDKPIFTSIIIVSDRRVLDNQLQETIMSLDHTPGVVETIGKGKTSKDLKDALNDNRKIIVTTLQKFPIIYEDVDDAKGKRYGVIIDEAHQSQTGSSAKMMKTALADTEEAFKPYYEATILDESINVNLIYDTQILLRNHGLYHGEDIEKFTNIYYKEGKQSVTDLGKITSLMKPIIERYIYLSEEDQFEFRKNLRNFNKWYSYIIQITRMYDRELHKEYVFTSYLQRLLPKPERINLDLEDKLKLEFYKLEQTFKGDISLNPTVEESTVSYGELDTSGQMKEDEDFLNEIIDRVNERYNGDFREGDRVVIDFIYKEASQGAKKDSLKTYAKKNDKEVFQKSIFPKDFEDISFKLYKENKDRDKSFEKLFRDKEYYNIVMTTVGEMLYRELNK